MTCRTFRNACTPIIFRIITTDTNKDKLPWLYEAINLAPNCLACVQLLNLTIDSVVDTDAESAPIDGETSELCLLSNAWRNFLCVLPGLREVNITVKVHLDSVDEPGANATWSKPWALQSYIWNCLPDSKCVVNVKGELCQINHDPRIPLRSFVEALHNLHVTSLTIDARPRCTFLAEDGPPESLLQAYDTVSLYLWSHLMPKFVSIALMLSALELDCFDPENLRMDDVAVFLQKAAPKLRKLRFHHESQNEADSLEFYDTIVFPHMEHLEITYPGRAMLAMFSLFQLPSLKKTEIVLQSDWTSCITGLECVNWLDSCPDIRYIHIHVGQEHALNASTFSLLYQLQSGLRKSVQFTIDLQSDWGCWAVALLKVDVKDKVVALFDHLVSLCSQAHDYGIDWRQRRPTFRYSFPRLWDYRLDLVDGQDASQLAQITLAAGHMPNLVAFQLQFWNIVLELGTFHGILALFQAQVLCWTSLQTFVLEYELSLQEESNEVLFESFNDAVKRLRETCERVGVVFEARQRM